MTPFHCHFKYLDLFKKALEKSVSDPKHLVLQCNECLGFVLSVGVFVGDKTIDSVECQTLPVLTGKNIVTQSSTSCTITDRHPIAKEYVRTEEARCFHNSSRYRKIASGGTGAIDFSGKQT